MNYYPIYLLKILNHTTNIPLILLFNNIMQVTVNNSLEPHDNNEIKFKILYKYDSNEILEYTTKDFIPLKHETIGISTEIDNRDNISFWIVYVYLVYKNVSYKYKFTPNPNAKNITIDLSHDTPKEMVKLNDARAYSINQMHIYSPIRFIYGWGSIDAGLDYVEESKNTLDDDCIIF